MKIARTKEKESSSEVVLSADCKVLIKRLESCSEQELLGELKKIKKWTFGKVNLYHWKDVLNRCDTFLERACHKEDENSWVPACDLTINQNTIWDQVLVTLQFSKLLIFYSVDESCYLYNSLEHLCSLLSSKFFKVVVSVLDVLNLLSKRKEFVDKLTANQRATLISRVSYIARRWDSPHDFLPDRRVGCTLVNFCQVADRSFYHSDAGTLHFEYYPEQQDENEDEREDTSENEYEEAYNESKRTVSVIKLELNHFHRLKMSPGMAMNWLLQKHDVPILNQMELFTEVQFVHCFFSHDLRKRLVLSRLKALVVWINLNAENYSYSSLLNEDLLKDLVSVVELTQPEMTEYRVAALRVLEAITVSAPKSTGLQLLFNKIIDVTGAASYHGFLSVLVQICVACLTGQQPPTNNGDCASFPLPLAAALFSLLHALASCRAGRVALVSCRMIESLLPVISRPGSNLESGLFAKRAIIIIDLISNIDMNAFQTHGGLQIFVNRLASEVEACLKEQSQQVHPPVPAQAAALSAPNGNAGALSQQLTGAEKPEIEMDVDPNSSPGLAASTVEPETLTVSLETCPPLRASLLELMLTLLKKAIQDTSFSDSIPHVMDGSLPVTLKHIISNAEYYGSSLFLLVTDVVTAYVCLASSSLSSLQDSGLTDVMLHSLLVKDVPATKGVLVSLPNIFRVLCLNDRGLHSFVAYKPFEGLFKKVFLSSRYLPTVSEQNSDPIDCTTTKFGTAMGELMQHQPILLQDATAGVIKLLEELCSLGCHPVEHNEVKESLSSNPAPARSGRVGAGSSETEIVASAPSVKRVIPLVKHMLNAMKFVDAFLGNHLMGSPFMQFVAQGGVGPLMRIFCLIFRLELSPNLPRKFPLTPACQSVATICARILNFTREPQVLKDELHHFQSVLDTLQPLSKTKNPPGKSVLLHGLAEAITSPINSSSLLHAMAAAHAYVVLFTHVCQAEQSDNTQLINLWGSPEGLAVLEDLCSIYSSLIFEINVMFDLTLTNPVEANTEEFKQRKIYWNTTFNLHRALSELFPLLIKLCVNPDDGSTALPTSISTSSAEAMAGGLTRLCSSGFDLVCEPSVTPPTPTFRLNCLNFSINSISPILFDEKKRPIHFMLQEFVNCGGQNAFFDTIDLVLSADERVPLDGGRKNLVYPENADAILKAWFILLEKMVNPKNILQLPVQLPQKAFDGSKQSLSPLQYLKRLHRQSFVVVKKLWSTQLFRIYGTKLTGLVLAILNHIVEGEVLIKKKLTEGKVVAVNSSGGIAAGKHLAGAEPNGNFFNPQHLQAVLSSSRSLCFPDTVLAAGASSTTSASNETDDNNEDTVMRTKALSLRSVTEEATSTPSLAAVAEVQLGQELSLQGESHSKQMNKFVHNVLTACCPLLKSNRMIENQVCRLVGSMVQRNGQAYREAILRSFEHGSDAFVTIQDYLATEEEGDTHDFGLHTNDSVNQHDDDDRVLVNVGGWLSDGPDIFLLPQLARVAKPHQVGGIRFLYEMVVRRGSGCLLAHSMGLGKTFQVCAFSEIFLRNTPTKTVLIIAPVNTIQNWKKEFNYWLPAKPGSNEPPLDSSIHPRKFNLYLIDDKTKDFNSRLGTVCEWSNEGGVLVIGYEMFRQLYAQREAIKSKTPLKKRVRIDLVQEEKERRGLERIYEALINPGPDVVVCDEGHRIRNDKTTTTVALKAIRTLRRVVLTGHPFQNDLLEFRCLIDFVRPDILGSSAEFRKLIDEPIKKGLCLDSSPAAVQLMKERVYVLHSLVKSFVQRRSDTVLTSTLLVKKEYVLMLRLSPLQRALYRKAMSSLLDSHPTFDPLKAFAISLKICNHPDVLYNFVETNKDDLDLDLDEDIIEISDRKRKKRNETSSSSNDATVATASASTTRAFTSGSCTTDAETDSEEEDMPPILGSQPSLSDKGDSYAKESSLNWTKEFFQGYELGNVENAAKTNIFFTILEEAVRLGDRLLLFSQSRLTLDLLEKLLEQRLIPGRKDEKWVKESTYIRMDGTVNSTEREILVNKFNLDPEVKLFLISTRAGSTGINLAGANRVVLFEPSWNPSQDAQAASRVYRNGQKKPCYIYRLVTDNSLERKIFDRQIGKQGTADRVVDELNPEAWLSLKESSSLDYEDEEDPPEEAHIKRRHSSDHSLSDPVLEKVMEQWGSSFTEDPFHHVTRPAESKVPKLSADAKRIAVNNYEDDKRAIIQNTSKRTRK